MWTKLLCQEATNPQKGEAIKYSALHVEIWLKEIAVNLSHPVGSIDAGHRAMDPLASLPPSRGSQPFTAQPC